MFYACDSGRNACVPKTRTRSHILSELGDLITFRDERGSERIGYKDIKVCETQCKTSAKEKKSYEALLPILSNLLPYLSAERIALPQIASEFRQKSANEPLDIRHQVTDNYKRCFRWMTSPQMSRSFNAKDGQDISRECMENANVWVAPFLNLLRAATGSSREKGFWKGGVWFSLIDYKDRRPRRADQAEFLDSKERVLQVSEVKQWPNLENPLFFRLVASTDLPLGTITRVQFLDAKTKKPLTHKPFKMRVVPVQRTKYPFPSVLQLTFRMPPKIQ